MSGEMKGQVALITGAARNMGRAFAGALAEKGCDIVVHYHSDNSKEDAEETARIVEGHGQRALLVQVNLSGVATIQAMFNEAKEAFGRIDVVINNAGKVIKRPFTDYSEENFNELFNINCKAAFFVMQAAANMIEDNGRIINLGTYLLGAFTGQYSLYAGSKAPLEDFTRALAKEIGHRGVTVNMVAPGPIDTEFFHGEENEQAVAYLSAASVLGRLGNIDDVVPTVKFIASPEARWVTGQSIFVNGGFVTR